MNLRYKLHNIWYAVKCFFIRYSTVKPRYLPHTWVDRCDLMPHMMFEILSRFMEEELLHYPERQGDKIDGRYVNDLMQDLYTWWHEEYNGTIPAEEDRLLDIMEAHGPNSLFSKVEGGYRIDPQFNSEEDEIAYYAAMRSMTQNEANTAELLQEKLQLLVKLIPYMWT